MGKRMMYLVVLAVTLFGSSTQAYAYRACEPWMVGDNGDGTCYTCTLSGEWEGIFGGHHCDYECTTNRCNQA